MHIRMEILNVNLSYILYVCVYIYVCVKSYLETFPISSGN